MRTGFLALGILVGACGQARADIVESGDLLLGGKAVIGGTVTVTGNAFSVGATTMSVKDGKLGVGTSAPASKLTIQDGDIRISTTSGSRGIIFQDGTMQTTAVSAADAVPSGTVVFSTRTSCPSGWSTLTAAAGRYIVATTDPSVRSTGTVVGTALSQAENRAVGQHNHTVTDPGHIHAIKLDELGNGGEDGWMDNNQANTNGKNTESATTGISINNAGSVAGTNAPYIQLLVCVKD